MNVRMIVQDDAAKCLLEQQQEPLRVRFQEMGVSVGQFDVAVTVRRTSSTAPHPKLPHKPYNQVRLASTGCEKLILDLRKPTVWSMYSHRTIPSGAKKHPCLGRPGRHTLDRHHE